MDVFFWVTNDLQCLQNTSNPLFIQQNHPIIMCHVFTSQRDRSPTAWSGLIVIFHHQSLILLCSCPSICLINGHTRAVSPTLLGSCDVIAGSSRRAEPFLLSFTVIITASCLCNFLSLPLLFPANVHSTECHHNPPPHQTPRPPLPRCRLIHCQAAPSGQDWSVRTVLS